MKIVKTKILIVSLQDLSWFKTARITIEFLGDGDGNLELTDYLKTAMVQNIIDLLLSHSYRVSEEPLPQTANELLVKLNDLINADDLSLEERLQETKLLLDTVKKRNKKLEEKIKLKIRKELEK